MKTMIKLFNQKLRINKGLMLAKTTLFTGLMFSAFISVSANLPASTPGTPETETTIKNYFKFPQVLIPHTEQKIWQSKKVEVLFTTDQFGKVNFALAKTEDRLLKQEVEKQFYKLSLPRVKTEVVHSVVLNFKSM